MESVVQIIRQSRHVDHGARPNKKPRETMVDGCKVRKHYAEIIDTKTVLSVQTMLISSQMDAALVTAHGGE